MHKTYRYANLESVTFHLDIGTVYSLLERAKEIPEGFELDREHTDDIDKFELVIRRVKESSPSLDIEKP